MEEEIGETARLQSSVEDPSEICYSEFKRTPVCRALWFSSGTVGGVAGFSCHVAQQGAANYFASALGVAMEEP